VREKISKEEGFGVCTYT